MYCYSKVLLLMLFTIATTYETPAPRLRYDTTSGRLFVDTEREPTISVYWDTVAQNVVSAAKGGPTIASRAYVTMHTSIMEAWLEGSTDFQKYLWRGYTWPRKLTTPGCSFQSVAASAAARFILYNSYRTQSELSDEAFMKSTKVCDKDKHYNAAVKLGQRIAASVSKRYSSVILPEQKVPIAGFTAEIERWRPERIPIDNPRGRLQQNLTPEWGRLFTYGIRNGASVLVPRPKPFLLIRGKLDMKERTIIPEGGDPIPVSRAIVGSIINPAFVLQAERIVNASGTLDSKEKFIAEFWEQGDGTSYPPGAWLAIAQYISARDKHSVTDDMRMFFALSNALHDAAVTTWYTKRFYYYCRPVRAIRDLDQLGLLGLVTYYDIRRGVYVQGPAKNFVTYQRKNADPSPPFPEFTSGHSGFSSASAEVLKNFTGSDKFEASVTLAAGTSRFESNREPKIDITLEWPTFSAAADEAGKSRIFGGIHFEDGDLIGRKLGRIVGRKVFSKASASSVWKRLKSNNGAHQFRKYSGEWPGIKLNS